MKIKMSDKRWKERITEWLAKVERLRERQREGFVYVRMYRGRVRVKKHTRAGHYAWVPMRPDTAKKLREKP